MTGEVLRFESPRVEYPSDRVASFIALAREIDTLVPHGCWDEDVWHVGSSFVTKGQNRSRRTLAFYNREAKLTPHLKIIGGAPLTDSFKEFAKAYIRYTHSTSPSTFENTKKRLDALRFIEAAFRSLRATPSPESLNVSVLNAAVLMAETGVSPGRHSQFALCIQQVYRFCMDRKFLNAPFQWRHGVKKPTVRTRELGAEAKQWREKKLPSPEAYRALAHIYRHSTEFVDRLYSAISAVMVSIPIRIHEVLQLRADCEVYDKVKDPNTDQMVDAYGIRVFPGKGNPPQVKWVPTQMASVVQDAIARIREMSADARQVAAWYEKNPGEVWLPEHLAHHRKSGWLPINGVPGLLTNQPNEMALKWLRAAKVELRYDLPKKVDAVNLASLSVPLLKMMPRDFPHFNRLKDQRYSETLIVAFRNHNHRTRGVYRTVIEMVTIDMFSQWLSGHAEQKNVFERWEFRERDGSPIEITSHAFRHWLNTVAQLKGLSDMDIAMWSGRKIEQNESYNHVSSDEILSQIREALGDGNGIGPIFDAVEAINVRQPVDRQEFADAQIGSALLTELGICVHDYSLLPCQTHGDCLGCSENVFIKGDRKHEERVTKRLRLTERQLEQAITAMGEDYFGADRWVESHKNSVGKLREMLAIHADTSIPDGTVVNLKGGSRDNEVAMALRDRSNLSATTSDNRAEITESDVLADMWEE
ncbi:hypothetical protein GOD94_16210 [Sinorhizobium medicae]|nr:hypothetical protein [Sinorhizobium medicae]MDX0874446.1 hypothetical protein [Sinorhizobium medicae]